MSAFEFYETPQAFTEWLFTELGIYGNVFEPCVGSGAILRSGDNTPALTARRWLTNDLDARWPATWHEDAANVGVWKSADKYGLDWTVTNPPFSFAIEILTRQADRRLRQLGYVFDPRRQRWMKEGSVGDATPPQEK